MKRSTPFAVIAVCAAAGACSSQPMAGPDTTGETAYLEPVALASAPSIEVPRVSGLSADASARINAELSGIREEAASSAQECVRAAGGASHSFDLTTEPTYNGDHILSLRMTGLAFCGGANPSTLTDARTFDLRTGEQINLEEVSGKSREALLAAAAETYRGPEACSNYLNDRDGDESIDTLFLTEDGIGVNFAFATGAAESCAEGYGLVEWSELEAAASPIRELAMQGQ